jgi:hypothetical protein
VDSRRGRGEVLRHTFGRPGSRLEQRRGVHTRLGPHRGVQTRLQRRAGVQTHLDQRGVNGLACNDVEVFMPAFDDAGGVQTRLEGRGSVFDDAGVFRLPSATRAPDRPRHSDMSGIPDQPYA